MRKGPSRHRIADLGAARAKRKSPASNDVVVAQRRSVGAWISLAAVVAVLGGLVALVLRTDIWVWFPNAWPSFGTLEQSPGFSEAQVAAGNEFLTMMLAILFGQFVMVGASISNGFSHHRRASVVQVCLLGVFGAMAQLSVAGMVYARVALLYQVSFGQIDLRQFVELAGVSAAFLGAAFVAAIAVVGHSLLSQAPGGAP